MLFAVDYSNMFLTNERPNPYSELSEEDPKIKEKKKEVVKETKEEKISPSLAKKSDLLYQAQFGFEDQSGFDKKGYGLIFSALKPVPDFFKNYKGSYIQIDFLYTIKDLETSTGVTKDYLALTAFGGYGYDLNEKTQLTARGGGSFVTGSGKFEVAYGLGVKRSLKDKRYKLIADWLIIGDLTVLSLGTEFSF